ncbi:MAG: Fe-S protein assembly co-chaperone HscB [Lewinellaceae bacterium]|nr:Fe-S protein assembly co-chaperone HscB [Lewinellaceae bacterium]
MDYFTYYDLPVSLRMDEADLRRRFLQKSKQYHPDFYTLQSEEAQQEALELSSINNLAFKTLKDPDSRMRYVLELKGLWGEEGTHEIPQEFLLEMMDINEGLMELEFDFDPALYAKAQNDLALLEENLLQQIQPILDQYDEQISPIADLLEVKSYLLKRKYLLRIKENLSRFATR